MDIVRLLLKNGYKEKGKDWPGFLQAASRLEKNRLSMMFELFQATFNPIALSEKDQELLSKLMTKRQERSAKKIYFWWIPICYDMYRPSGQRMAQRNYEKYLALF